MDGDNRQQEQDERREREEMERSLKEAAYADYHIRRDLDRRHYGSGAHETAPDGRPLFVGTMQYETWCKADRRSQREKESR